MSVGRTSLLLAPLAIGARAVAFFVPVVIADWYGVQPLTDAFFWVLAVPTFLLVLASTTLGAVLVPQLARLRAESPERLAGFVGAAATWSGLATGGVGTAFALSCPYILRVATPFDDATRALATTYAWTLLPFVVSVAVGAVLRATCEVHGRFSFPVAAPVVRAITTMGIVYALKDTTPFALPAGFVGGYLGELTLLAGVLALEGVRPRPSLAIPDELREALRAYGPVLGGETMVALNVFVDKLFAGTGPEGSVSLLEYADRARQIPQTLLESTLLVVAFNAWAAARARGEDQGRHRAVATTLWWVCLLAPPVLGGMVVGREPLVRLLYRSFSPEHSHLVASTLAMFLPGTFLSLLGALAAKAHIVEGRYGLMLRLGALSLTLNAVLDAVLMPRFGLVGLAAATSITTAVVTTLSFARLLPSLRGALPLREALRAGGLVVVSTALTVAAIATDFRPATIADPLLWAASLPFFGLLGAGALRARRGP